MWLFEPLKKVRYVSFLTSKVGDHITQGDIFGKVEENSLVTHFIMMPPGEKGTIIFIAPAANYTVEVVIRLFSLL